MIGSANDPAQPFAKTICSICYEDLKPIVEDLQAISICGHVFHELCIQQWFEYCSKGKKKCPICKQNCSASNVSRLYFQSVGDANEPKLSQKLQSHKEDPEELQIEVRRLEGKVKGLNSALGSREDDLKNISNELCVCKEQLKKESALKNEALEQTQTINRLLNMKTQELNKSDLERIKLQERNMALAKELASFKLVSDLNLEEEEIVKLASLGTGAHSKESSDVLKKSLVVRNKMYKELIAKCNTLGREEAHTRKKLEKAKEKVDKLKKRIQELETTNEIKDNEVLRALKASRTTKRSVSVLNGVDSTSIDTCTPQDTIKEDVDQVAAMSIDPVHLRNTKRLKVSENIDGSNNKDGFSTPDPGISSYILIDDDTPEVLKSHEFSSFDPVPEPTKSATNGGSCLSRPVHETRKQNGVSLNHKDEDVLLLHEIPQNKSPVNITKEALPVVNSQEGDFCFSAGLLGPDGTKRHLGKWCKKGQNKGFNASSIPTQVSGNLIAIGADGRGGTIKVLRSQNLSSQDCKESSVLAKNGKYGTKTSSLQPRGCLQIDHFFRKAGQ
ncbi:E3 ubiquitin-protein ligase TRAIP [Cynara cardunculus var. scolymus]|uniref:E3 ubiquitin-protein ligase TRAIP n=1 Tax=Cynara cardunculus var. scolymus TaxID=59895 RepID=UPI000D627A9A|nr:E3 ubiquitin-protein ligase TRAIP [Cynara cardunculus var. scolymus]